MKRALVGAVSFAALALGGCANNGGNSVVGTWTGRGSPADAPFSFGAVSFVGDNTFTAEARYGGQARMQHGTWETSGDRLALTANGSQREYTYKVDDGELTVTDPGSGNSVTLDRVKK
jgi:uncharacterized lipoprotein NlpE involved in copper resistance